MKRVILFLYRFRWFLLTAAVLVTLLVLGLPQGNKALGLITFSFREMALVFPPVFILLGLLDVWVPRETMMKYMGDKSGLKGIILAFVIGSAAAGPLYAAFPVAAVLIKKGAKFSNVMIFMGAWSTTKLPMFLFESAALGAEFAVTRLLVNIPGIIVIAYILNGIFSEDEKGRIFEATGKMAG